jgi:hypothetical protein
MHFPLGLPDEYYKGLTAERLVSRYHRGFLTRVWEKDAAERNEPLDLEVYAYAAAIYAGVTRVNWDRSRRRCAPPRATSSSRRREQEGPTQADSARQPRAARRPDVCTGAEAGGQIQLGHGVQAMNSPRFPATSRPRRAPASPGSGGARTCRRLPGVELDAQVLVQEDRRHAARTSPSRPRPTATTSPSTWRRRPRPPTPPATTPGRRCHRRLERGIRGRPRRFKLLARYDQAANLDDRSHARKVLDAIEAVIENRATLDQQEYTIGSRHLKRMTVAELIEFRDKYRGESRRRRMLERMRNGQGGNRLVVKL